MNSSRTIFPRNEESVTVCPVGPFWFTTGRLKSGAKPDWTVVLTELVRELEVAWDGWVNEYTDQAAIMIMIGIAIFSHLLKP